MVKSDLADLDAMEFKDSDSAEELVLGFCESYSVNITVAQYGHENAYTR